LGVNSSQ